MFLEFDRQNLSAEERRRRIIAKYGKQPGWWAAMYGAEPDPYCYPGTDILANVPGLRAAAALEQFELAIVAQRASERSRPAG
jgi:hypothetical protein